MPRHRKHRECAWSVVWRCANDRAHWVTGLLGCLAGVAAIMPLSVRAADAVTGEALRESRGIWLDKAQIVEGRAPLAKRLDRLQEAGFNTVYVATQVRGTVIYPNSAILPQYEPARRGDPDILAWLLTALRERGMRAEAWTEFGFYAYWTADASTDASRGVILDAHPELAAISAEGKMVIHNPKYGDFYTLCPANPQAQDILIDLYTEMLSRYRFDGLHLDRIRFPNAGFCACAYCRAHFERDTHLSLSATMASNQNLAPLVRWRKQQINAFVERLTRTVRTRFPDRTITSAVVPPGMIDAKGQDWPVWIERGWVDAVAVMLYGDKIDRGLAWIHRRLPAAAPVYIGLDAAPGTTHLLAQINAVRAQSFPGVVVWYSGTVDPLLAKLRTTVFAKPATAPLSAPSPRDAPPSGGTPE